MANKNTLKSVKNKIVAIAVAVKSTVFSIKIIPIILLIVMGATLFNWVRELIHARDTSQAILEALQVQDLDELVTLGGNDEEGYYFNDPYDNNGLICYPKETVEERHRAQHMQAVGVRKNGK